MVKKTLTATDHLERVRDLRASADEVGASYEWIMTRLGEHGRLTEEWHAAQTDKGKAELRLQRAKASIQQLVNEVARLREEQEFGHAEDCLVCMANNVLQDRDEVLLAPSPADLRQRAEDEARTLAQGADGGLLYPGQGALRNALGAMRSEGYEATAAPKRYWTCPWAEKLDALRERLRAKEQPAPAEGGKMWVDGRITVAHYDKSGTDEQGRHNVAGHWRFTLDVLGAGGEVSMQRAMDVPIHPHDTFQLDGVRVLVTVAGA